jgi:hypothetical protein
MSKFEGCLPTIYRALKVALALVVFFAFWLAFFIVGGTP